MRANSSSIRFDDFAEPIDSSPSAKAIPQLIDFASDIDDIVSFRMVSSPDQRAGSTRLPGKRLTGPDGEGVPVPPSLIRQIEREVRNNQWDARTVFESCRGLKRGSSRFEDAYIAARVLAYSKRPRSSMDSPPVLQDNVIPLPSFRHITKSDLILPRCNPMAVLHLGHLIRHFGIWLVALLAAQVWSSWKTGAFAAQYLEGGRYFYTAITLVLMMAVNSWVWFNQCGKVSKAFYLPGAWLFLLGFLPGFVLHLRGLIQSLG